MVASTTGILNVDLREGGSGTETSDSERARWQALETFLEESIFLHEGVISSRSGVDHVYLAHALKNRALEQEGSMRLINNMRLITRVNGILLFS